MSVPSQQTLVRRFALVLVAGALIATALMALRPPRAHCTAIVTATAYTSHRRQTDRHPRIAAWGDRLEDDTPAIAVSRDLIRLGLGRGVSVEIEGLEQEFIVLDKMARRWRRKIDIFMGSDVDAAREWGKRQVKILWRCDDPQDY